MNRFLLNYQSKIKRAAPLSSFSLFLFHPLFMFGNHCNLEQISTSNLNKCQFLIFEFFFFLKNERWVSIYCKQLQRRSIFADNHHWRNPTVFQLKKSTAHVQWYANDWHILIVVKIWKMCQSLACQFCWSNKQYFFETTWNFESNVISTNMVLRIPYYTESVLLTNQLSNR